MKNNHFRLSAAGKLAAVLAIILAASNIGYAGEIVPTDGATGPGIFTASTGAQVINIVTPDSNGLSHNQYQDFNVNQSGAVLNNSRQAGQSQLAGPLDANPNLGGREARVILNEVIGRNPSLLHGQQEIFGMAADYVLANPNGISCQDCGFINTPSTSLVVGDPLLVNSKVKRYYIGDKNRATLSLNGRLETQGALNLIAPTIDSRGDVIVQDFTHHDGEVTQSQITTLSMLDGYYLGSMQAGRINIITPKDKKDSGVRLVGSLHAGDGLTVKAYNIRSESGVKSSSSSKKYHIRNLHSSHSSNTQTQIPTKLTGKNILLLADNHLHLSATDIRGEDITLQGAKLTLDGQGLKWQETQSDDNTDNNQCGSLCQSVHTLQEQEQQIGSTVAASGSAKLISTQEDMKLLGVNVSTDRAMSLKGARDIHLAGLLTKTTSRELGFKGNNANRRHNVTDIEILKPSQLDSQGTLMLEAGNRVFTKGAKVHANHDLTINADERIWIDVQKTTTEKIANTDRRRGGIDNKRNISTISYGSTLTSDGTLRLNGKQGVIISGSKVYSKQDALVDTGQSSLHIDNVLNTSKDKIYRYSSGFFTSNKFTADNLKQESIASELKSDTNLRVVSHHNVGVTGSQVTSSDELSITSQTGHIYTQAAPQQQKSDEQKTALTLNGYAKEVADKQYRTGLRLEHTRASKQNTRTENRFATLRGDSVTLETGQNVIFVGSRLIANKGDARISGTRVTFLAADNKTSLDTQQTTIGGGVYYTGGLDKFGRGVEAGYANSQTHAQSSQALPSGSDVKGNLIINARDKIIQQGAQHLVGGIYQEYAASVDHLAATDSTSTTTHKTNVEVDISPNVDYSAVTRPVEGMLNKTPSLEDTRALYAPNLGLDIGAQGGGSEKRSSSLQAVVSSVKADSIDIKANGTVRDQGTQYKAINGAINLEADSHRSETAVNRQDEQSRDTRGNAKVRAYTTTGRDLTVDIKGAGGTQRSESRAHQVVTGSLKAAHGINVTVKKDALYQGTALNGGSGRIAVNAGGDIRLDQASDSQHESHRGFNVQPSAIGGFTADSKHLGAGLGGRISNGERSSSTAQVSKIDGQQGVEVNAGRDLTLQGTKVLSQGDVTLNARNQLALQAAQSEQHNDNWSLGISIKGKKTFSNHANGKKDAHILGGSLKVGVDQLDKLTHDNTVIKAGDVTLNSAKDTRLTGARIEADRVQGKMGGDLLIDSPKDVEKGVKVDVDVKLRHSNDPDSSISAHLSQLGTGLYASQVQEKLDGGVNKVADTITDKYNRQVSRFSSQQNPTGDKPTGPLWDHGARTIGGGVKDSIIGPLGRDGLIKANVDVVDNNAVGEQSAITGKNGVALQVGAQTQLTGGAIRSPQGKVELGDGKVSLEDVSGQHYRGGGRVDTSITVGGLLVSAAKQIVDGKVPLVSGYASTQPADAKAEVFRGK
ncbi:hemagglutinin repeat-containing protein [Xenorhabdus sp. Vera]|uniref:hemagglutinin repeat-containing protein n=1 Tax=Xenorhabdus koppenhoeferi TaxID=351659 RepID=UPI0019AE62DA|nr:hemagglutinin repeat-containing protein [Xenorhabdus sp. Vera]MBD2809311.1 hemagglutinin repeat-containing protein [Xenorhabdus sp. Vera]